MTRSTTPLALAVALLAVVALPITAQSSAKPPPPGQLERPPQSQLSKTISAPPLTVAKKFNFRVVQSFGLRSFALAAMSAGIGQAENSPHEWGQGSQGFAKRYASAFGGSLSHQTFAFLLETKLHEDPRYFPSDEKGFKHRAWNALKQVFLCKNDDGSTQFAYARVVSDFGNSQFVNLWQPNSTGTFGRGIERGFIGLGVDAAYNFIQEFIPFTRPASLRHRH